MDDELMRALARVRRAERAAEPTTELSESARARLLANVFDRIDAEVAAEPTGQAPAVAMRRRWVIPLALALAAALVLLVLRPGATGPALPSYAVTRAEGGAADVRAARDDGPWHLALATPRDVVDIVVTPSTTARAEVEVTLVARSAEGPVVQAVVTDRAERASRGAIRLQGPLDGLVALTPGRWRLHVVISPPGDAPRDPAVLDAPTAEPWRVAGLDVTIAGP